MKQPDSNVLIERYLSGEMPANERAAVEKRAEDDALFRAELALQQAVHDEFAEAEKLEFRKSLAEAMRNLAEDL